MPNKIGIIDYGIGNLYSVEKALLSVGETPYFITNPDDIIQTKRLLLPGVGAFQKCYRTLESRGFIEPIRRHIGKNKPFLGICVGMQLLMESSNEGGHCPGLGIIKGEVRFLGEKSGDKKIKTPHIGWKPLNAHAERATLLHDAKNDDEYYFVHSYSANVTDTRDTQVVSASYEGLDITAYIEKGHTYACQFHPEKSRQAGLRFLKNFALIPYDE